MKDEVACDTTVGGTCWDYLISVLRSAHPTRLGDSLRLTRVAEDYYRRMSANGNGKIGGRKR